MKKALHFAFALAGASLTLELAAQNFVLEPSWNLDPASRAYLTTDNTQRGISYNPVTGNVLLVNRNTALSVNRLAGATGADNGTIDLTGVSGGTFPLNQIGVADDGAIYAANLVTTSAETGTSAFKIYRWASESATPTVAYSGSVSTGLRWGDNFTIRGAGNSVEILVGQGTTGNNIALFRSSDGGLTVTPTVMAVTGLPSGEARGGIGFGNGNTFFVKSASGASLNYVTYDPVAGTASRTANATLPTGLNGFGPLGVDAANNLLAAVQLATTGTAQQNLYLFGVSDPAAPVQLDVEGFVNPGFANGNGAGSVDFGGGKVFALDTNNGLRAFNVVVPEPHEYAAMAGGLLISFALVRRCQKRPVAA